MMRTSVTASAKKNVRTRTGLVILGLAVCYWALWACQDQHSIRKAQYIINGKNIYATHCQNCHGNSGEGLGKLYPPLTDLAYLENNREQLACFVKHGMSGEISIHGEPYNTPMPANPQLAPVDIAYVLTYITNSFGNEMPMFTVKEVTASLENCE